MSFYITEKSMHDVLTAAKGIQKTANEKLNEKISLETALQLVNVFMICDEISNLRGIINNLNLILRHEDY
jgi:hypothetical protein